MSSSAILNLSQQTYTAVEKSPIENVPNEILKIIFDYLPRPLDILYASRVCKKWRVLCLNILPLRLDSLFIHKFLLNQVTALSPQVYFSHFRPFSAHVPETRSLKKLHSSSWANPDSKITSFDFSNDHLAISYKVNNNSFPLFYADYRKSKSTKFQFENEISEIFIDASTQKAFFIEKQKGLGVIETDFKCYLFEKYFSLKIKSKNDRCYYLDDTKCSLSFVDNKKNQIGVAVPSLEEQWGQFAKIEDYCLSSDHKIFASYETTLSNFSNGRGKFVFRDSLNLYGWDIETSKIVTSFPTENSHLISTDENLLVSYELSRFCIFDTKSTKEVFKFKLEEKYRIGTTQLILEDFCVYSLTSGIFQVRDLRKPDTAFEPLGDMSVSRFAYHNDIFLFLSDDGNLEFYSFRQKDTLDKLRNLAQGFSNFFKNKK